jgi:hypothetical protein
VNENSGESAGGVLPVEILREAVESCASYLQPSGEMHDPVFGQPTQYGTPYHALCNSVLAREAGGDRKSVYVDRAVRGLEAALDHVLNSGLPPTASGFDHATGRVTRSNHRDFFWPPILKTFLILRDLGVDGAEDFARRISSVDIEASFSQRPPSNWAAVWLSGEWLRMREGLSPFSLERLDLWLDAFFGAHILTEQGLYQEPGHPNSYDLFTRYHLADMLLEGYAGRRREDLELLLRTGASRSLGVQLSDGSLASAHRSTGKRGPSGPSVHTSRTPPTTSADATPIWRDALRRPPTAHSLRSGAGSGQMALTAWSRTVCRRVTGSAMRGIQPTATTATWRRLSWQW